MGAWPIFKVTLLFYSTALVTEGNVNGHGVTYMPSRTFTPASGMESGGMDEETGRYGYIPTTPGPLPLLQ